MRREREPEPQSVDLNNNPQLVRLLHDAGADSIDVLRERIFKQARRYLGKQRDPNAEFDADDIAQKLVTNFLLNIDNYNSPGDFGAWLAAGVVHECQKELIKWTKQRKLVSLTETLEDHPENNEVLFKDTSLSALDELIEQETAAIRQEDISFLNQAMGLLNGRERTIISVLTHRQARGQKHYDYKSISQEIGIPVGSIGPTYTRAIKRLRKNLEILKLKKSSTKSLAAGK